MTCNMGSEKKRSCETQLVMMIDDLVRNASAGKQTDVNYTP